MRRVKIVGEQIRRDDGSSLDRAHLSSAVLEEDHQLNFHRSQPSWFGVILLGAGLLVLWTASSVESTESWPLGDKSAPLAVLAAVVGGIWTVKSVQVRRAIPHLAVCVRVGSGVTHILRTNDKAWAQRVVTKLSTIANKEAGDWEIDAQEKSITQL